jgi:PEP-CTERM motif
LRIAITLFVLATAAFGSPINIVQNGDFETGDLTGWTTNQQVHDPWQIESQPHGGSFNAFTGCEQDPCINGDPSMQNPLSQSLSTIIGDSYTLSFFYDPGSVDEGGVSELLAQWGGTAVADLLLNGNILLSQSSISPITPAPGYNMYTITGLTATSTSTQLTFLGRQDPSFSRLDDIVVTDNSAASVPEPASYALIAAGLFALSAAVRRNRRQRSS